MTTGIRRSAGVLLVGLSAFTLAACGENSSAGGITESQIRDKWIEELQSQTSFSEEQATEVADCMAPKMVDQLSDETLQKFLDSDENTNFETELPDDEKEKFGAIGIACFGSIPTPSQ